MNQWLNPLKSDAGSNLVKAFLIAGILSEDGAVRGSKTGTPQGGILSPCLANIALSALDEHFAETWRTTMATNEDRVRRRRRGLPMYRLVRYADLSGSLDKSAYAERRVMPSEAWDRPWLLGSGG